MAHESSRHVTPTHATRNITVGQRDLAAIRPARPMWSGRCFVRCSLRKGLGVADDLAAIPKRELLDALFYVVRTGCAWRMLPREFPPWEMVYAAFRSWGRQGTFASMHRELHGLWRERLGRASMPSAVIVDSQSTKRKRGASLR